MRYARVTLMFLLALFVVIWAVAFSDGSLFRPYTGQFGSNSFNVAG